jgi:hypothetical protein
MIIQSKIFVFVIYCGVIGTIFCFGWRRTNTSIASFGSYNIFFVAKLSPAGHSFLSASLPLLLSQYSKLFNDFFGLHFFHLPVKGRLLKLNNVIFLVFEVFEYFQAGFLILFLKGGFWKG